MKRLMILAAAAAISPLAGSAHAETPDAIARDLLACLDLEREQPGSCVRTDARVTVEAILDNKTGDTVKRPVPQSLTQ